MAIASWLTVLPKTGSGNGTVKAAAAEHTGRSAKNTTVTVTANGLSGSKTVTVTQSGKAEFVSFDNGDNMAASKTAGNVTITGKSNSQKLTFAWAGSVSGATLPETFTVNGTAVNNGTAITGDPGAAAEYEFSITIPLTANNTVSPITRDLTVTANGSQAAQISIVQAAGDPTLSVSPTTLTIPAAGGEVSFAVTSNTSWTIS